jgi:hypothetical protein
VPFKVGSPQTQRVPHLFTKENIMFKIEKNIPLAAKQSYPFDQMESGDSFFVAVSEHKKIGYIRAQINNVKKKYPNKIISTRIENGGLRIWMINKEQS